MSSYWNWYHDCPFCDDEIECHVEENSAPDGFWVWVDFKDECTSCGVEFDASTRLALEEVVVEHYTEYHERPDKW